MLVCQQCICIPQDTLLCVQLVITDNLNARNIGEAIKSGASTRQGWLNTFQNACNYHKLHGCCAGSSPWITQLTFHAHRISFLLLLIGPSHLWGSVCMMALISRMAEKLGPLCSMPFCCSCVADATPSPAAASKRRVRA